MSQNQIRKTLSSLQVSKCPNTLKLYALKSLLTKNCFSNVCIKIITY